MWSRSSRPPAGCGAEAEPRSQDDHGACHKPDRLVTTGVAAAPPPTGTPDRRGRSLTCGFSCSPVWT